MGKRKSETTPPSKRNKNDSVTDTTPPLTPTTPYALRSRTSNPTSPLQSLSPSIKKRTPRKSGSVIVSTPRSPAAKPKPVKSDPNPVLPKASASCSNQSQGNDSNVPPVERISDQIIKSPLDTHEYRMVRLANGLKGLLVSTCLHELDPDIRSGKISSDGMCIFKKIDEFNECHCNFKTKPSSSSTDPPKNDSAAPNFSKASNKKEKAIEAKRAKAAKKKMRCKRGPHEQDDELQNFCNNYSCVTLFIRAGFFQDPQDMPGMAHFCEHAITLGSEKYPEIEALAKFVEGQGGGFYNACTAYEFTAYFFYVKNEYLLHALEIFVDCVINPIFSRNNISQEIDSINSEYEAKRTNESIQQLSLLQACFPEGHPAANFGLGSRDSLTQNGKRSTDEMVNRLIEWMGQYYSTENMLFAIQCLQSLDDLEQLFSKYFSKVPKTFKNSPPTPLPIPMDPCQSSKLPLVNWSKWNRLYHMTTSGNNNSMSVSWLLHPKFGKNFETKPLHYFSYILSKTEHGSLDWYLKKQGWITAIHVNYPESFFSTTEHFTIFNIHLDLTEDGLPQRIPILRAIFSYIKLLQNQKASKMIFNEVRQLQSDLFHYRSDINLSDPTIGRRFVDAGVCETLFNLMNTFARSEQSEQLLLNHFLTTKFDALVLNEFINSLKPSNAMVVFISNKFEEKADQINKSYGARYYTKPLCSDLKKELESQTLCDFSFPKANPFVAVSACYPDERTDKLEHRTGLLACQSAKGCVTYGNAKCTRGLLPSAVYTIEILSPALEDYTDIMNRPSMDILVLLLRYVLDSQLASAMSSLISYDVSLVKSKRGVIAVNLFGPSPKLPLLGSIVLESLVGLADYVQAKKDTVVDLIKVQIGNYKDLMSQPDKCGNLLLRYVINQGANFVSDFAHMLETSYDEEDFLLFVEHFASRLYIKADLNGCVANHQAMEFAQHLESIPISPYCKNEENKVFGHALALPVGERCLAVLAKDQQNRNSVVVNYYQMHFVTQKDYEILRAIWGFLASTAFDELRTKQGLGYYVEVDCENIEGIRGMKIFLQGTSDKHTCGYINECIDDYLANTCNQETFEHHINEWISNFEEDAENAFSLLDVKRFYKERLLPTGCNFRKLSVQIQGYKKSAKAMPIQPSRVNEKVETFCSRVPLKPCGSGVNGGSCGVSVFSKYLDLDLKGVKEENGYFITDIRKFKNATPCLGNMFNALPPENDEVMSD